MKLVVGKNDLATVRPDLIAEWDYKKNGDLKPIDVSPGRGRTVWWKCPKCGGSWQSTVQNRANGSGCPYCSGRRALPGFNDLETKRPDLAAEWDYDRNGDLKPTNVKAGSSRKVWWKCPKCGGSWQNSVQNRANGSGCPYCTGKRALPGVNDLATTHPELAAEWDYDRNGALEPTDVKAGSGRKVWWKCPVCGESWRAAVNSRIYGHGCPNCRKDQRPRRADGENDLQTRYPDLASQWDYEKNGDVKPSDVTPGSGRTVWWKCPKCGGSWRSTVIHRTNGSGCPYCSGKKVLPGFNDLATVRPDLVVEWDYEKNGDLKPSGVTQGGRRKIWWKCPKCGGSWKSTVANRVNGKGCPYCSGRRALPGVNDLETLRPDLVAEWDYDRNGDLKPESVRPGSNVVVWWRCPTCGYEWLATVNTRMNGHGCPNYRNHPDAVADRLSQKLSKGGLTKSQIEKLRAAGIDLIGGKEGNPTHGK